MLQESSPVESQPNYSPPPLSSGCTTLDRSKRPSIGDGDKTGRRLNKPFIVFHGWEGQSQIRGNLQPNEDSFVPAVNQFLQERMVDTMEYGGLQAAFSMARQGSF